MHIILFRHGIAEDHAPDGTDASRRLTDKGIAKTSRCAAGLRKVIDPPAAVFTSPKVRAMQTAEILGATFDRRPQKMEALAEQRPQAVIEQIGRLSVPSVILVGHEPTLSTVAGLLCGLSARGGIDLKKAGCIGLDIADDHASAHLQWLLTPRMLEALAG